MDIYTYQAGQEELIVLADSLHRNLYVFKQRMEPFKALASNPSRRRILQTETCVSGYA